MTRTPIHSFLICTILSLILSCEKNNDPPLNQKIQNEEFLSSEPGEMATITINGNDLTCKRVGDLYIFQQDMIITANQLNKTGNLKGVGLNTMDNYWEFGAVYYTIEEGFPDADRIYQAIAHWEEYTELGFFERSNEPNYIEFVESSDGTAAQVGMVGGKQYIWLADWATTGSVIHEVGHAIGLFHEHSKPNRDEHILIHPENMEPGMEINFQLLDEAIYTEGFDFSSIMLYTSFGGSKNGEPTITKLDGSVFYTQRDYLTQADIEAVKKMYEDFVCLDCVRGQVTDIDLNTYHTVKIGDQWWMAENLATTRYTDGTEIPNVSSNWDWYDLSSEAYCWYENDEETYKDPFGALYNYYTVEDDRLCPEGWQVPSESEWQELELFLGMSSSEASKSGRRGTIEGGKLKAEGFAHWYEPNTGATNESGFKGLPGGYRYYSDGDFYDLGSAGYWWAIELAEDDLRPYTRELGSTHSQIERFRPYDASGYSVRCIKY